MRSNQNNKKYVVEINEETTLHFFTYHDWAAIAYPKTSDTNRTLIENNPVDQSDVLGASPIGAALNTSSFSI